MSSVLKKTKKNNKNIPKGVKRLPENGNDNSNLPRLEKDEVVNKNSTIPDQNIRKKEKITKKQKKLLSWSEACLSTRPMVARNDEYALNYCRKTYGEPFSLGQNNQLVVKNGHSAAAVDRHVALMTALSKCVESNNIVILFPKNLKKTLDHINSRTVPSQRKTFLFVRDKMHPGDVVKNQAIGINYAELRRTLRGQYFCAISVDIYDGVGPELYNILFSGWRKNEGCLKYYPIFMPFHGYAGGHTWDKEGVQTSVWYRHNDKIVFHPDLEVPAYETADVTWQCAKIFKVDNIVYESNFHRKFGPLVLHVITVTGARAECTPVRPINTLIELQNYVSGESLEPFIYKTPIEYAKHWQMKYRQHMASTIVPIYTPYNPVVYQKGQGTRSFDLKPIQITLSRQVTEDPIMRMLFKCNSKLHSDVMSYTVGKYTVAEQKNRRFFEMWDQRKQFIDNGYKFVLDHWQTVIILLLLLYIMLPNNVNYKYPGISADIFGGRLTRWITAQLPSWETLHFSKIGEAFVIRWTPILAVFLAAGFEELIKWHLTKNFSIFFICASFSMLDIYGYILTKGYEFTSETIMYMLFLNTVLHWFFMFVAIVWLQFDNWMRHHHQMPLNTSTNSKMTLLLISTIIHFFYNISLRLSVFRKEQISYYHDLRLLAPCDVGLVALLILLVVVYILYIQNLHSKTIHNVNKLMLSQQKFFRKENSVERKISMTNSHFGSLLPLRYDDSNKSLRIIEERYSNCMTFQSYVMQMVVYELPLAYQLPNCQFPANGIMFDYLKGLGKGASWSGANQFIVKYTPGVLRSFRSVSPVVYPLTDFRNISPSPINVEFAIKVRLSAITKYEYQETSNSMVQKMLTMLYDTLNIEYKKIINSFPEYNSEDWWKLFAAKGSKLAMYKRVANEYINSKYIPYGKLQLKLDETLWMKTLDDNPTLRFIKPRIIQNDSPILVGLIGPYFTKLQKLMAKGMYFDMKYQDSSHLVYFHYPSGKNFEDNLLKALNVFGWEIFVTAYGDDFVLIMNDRFYVGDIKQFEASQRAPLLSLVYDFLEKLGFPKKIVDLMWETSGIGKYHVKDYFPKHMGVRAKYKFKEKMGTTGGPGTSCINTIISLVAILSSVQRIIEKDERKDNEILKIIVETYASLGLQLHEEKSSHNGVIFLGHLLFSHPVKNSLGKYQFVLDPISHITKSVKCQHPIKHLRVLWRSQNRGHKVMSDRDVDVRVYQELCYGAMKSIEPFKHLLVFRDQYEYLKVVGKSGTIATHYLTNMKKYPERNIRHEVSCNNLMLNYGLKAVYPNAVLLNYVINNIESLFRTLIEDEVQPPLVYLVPGLNELRSSRE